MKTCHISACRGIVLTVALLLFMPSLLTHGQNSVYLYFYRVYFKDKGENTGSWQAVDLLSPRSISRHEKAGLVVPDFRDIPVLTAYTNEISSLGLTLHCTSKWMNTALFKSYQPVNTGLLLKLPFVSDVRIVKVPGMKSKFKDKLDFETTQSTLPPYERPITMLNGNTLQNAGFTGKNILIAVLDGGFINADIISALNDLRSRNGILKTKDFVNNNSLVYNASNHGTAVLSILAGNLPGFISGTAKGAEFMLLKTEDVETEFPCEEDFWAAGAEFADSAGADIISSSLGYYFFDDPSMNYKLSDLDGNTAFITRVADIAASKGILVVNSAGNERDNIWQKIIFPSDGDSVIAAGAVDGNNVISYFSSSGPSADGRIKPDNVAMGVSVPVQTANTLVNRSNGTSFSCPILSGMAACLMQAVPKSLNQDIIDAFHQSADRYNVPDSLYGYGIPDMAMALVKLQDKYLPVNDDVLIFPNPSTGDFELIFHQPPGNLVLEIYSVTGRLILRKEFQGLIGRTIVINDLQRREQGIYLLKLIRQEGTSIRKIIRIKE